MRIPRDVTFRVLGFGQCVQFWEQPDLPFLAPTKALPALVPPFSTSRSSPFFLRMTLLPMRKLEKTARPKPM